MKSAHLSRLSAFILGAPAVALLFGADNLLPTVIPGFTSGSAWVGQLAASGWIAVAMLNWMSRNAVIGGIFARPLVLTNLTVYVVTATTLSKAAALTAFPEAMLVASAMAAGMAAAYGWLMMRGPLPADTPR
jgi:hypothetical protein